MVDSDNDKTLPFRRNESATALATYDAGSGLKANEMFQLFEDSHGDIWLSQQPLLADSGVFTG